MNSSSAVSLSTAITLGFPASVGHHRARARDVRPYRHRTVAPFRPGPDRSNIIAESAQAVPPAKWKGTPNPNTKISKAL
ncbi:MAG: hypothetical protein ACXVGG_07855 [Mycobacteriaceae bacterium]